VSRFPFQRRRYVLPPSLSALEHCSVLCWWYELRQRSKYLWCVNEFAAALLLVPLFAVLTSCLHLIQIAHPIKIWKVTIKLTLVQWQLLSMIASLSKEDFFKRLMALATHELSFGADLALHVALAFLWSSDCLCLFTLFSFAEVQIEPIVPRGIKWKDMSNPNRLHWNIVFTETVLRLRVTENKPVVV